MALIRHSKAEIKIDEQTLDALNEAVRSLDDRIDKLVDIISKVERVTEKAQKVIADLNRAVDRASTTGRTPLSGRSKW